LTSKAKSIRRQSTSYNQPGRGLARPGVMDQRTQQSAQMTGRLLVSSGHIHTTLFGITSGMCAGDVGQAAPAMTAQVTHLGMQTASARSLRWAAAGRLRLGDRVWCAPDVEQQQVRLSMAAGCRGTRGQHGRHFCASASPISVPLPHPFLCLCLTHFCASASPISVPLPHPFLCLCLTRLVAPSAACRACRRMFCTLYLPSPC